MVIVEEKRTAPKALGINLDKYNYRYSITDDERRLLIEYLERKDDLGENRLKLEKELGEYFAQKLEIPKNESEYESFLDEVLK